MKNTYSLVAALLVGTGLLLAGPAARAQVFTPTTPVDPAKILADTTERREVVVSPEARKQKAAADSAKRTEHMFRAFGFKGIRLTRPGKAAMLALVLPGAGQIYNHSWWKLPLVYGALGGTIAGEVFYQTRYKQFVEALDIVGKDPTKINSQELAPVPRLYNSYEALSGSSGIVFYRGYRDIFYLYIGIAYGLQIVDALVDAHLKDFDVSDDLTFHWEPTLMAVPGQAAALPTNPGLTFALRVK